MQSSVSEKFLGFMALLCLMLIAACAHAPQGPPPTLFIVGDSTVKNSSGKGDGGMWGWGSVVDPLFDPAKITLANHAIGGRSSRSFRTEGRWDRVLAAIKPGDFVIIQFGHNDGGELFKGNRPRASLKGAGEETRDGTVEATGKAETVHTYGWYMRQYATEAKEKGATAIICSQVPRNIWKDGKVERVASSYGGWAKAAAADAGAFFIDLNEIVARRYDPIGGDAALKAKYFVEDHTHTNRAGAEMNAQCVAAGIKALRGCALRDYLAPAAKTIPAADSDLVEAAH